jgi:hypothetical protein
VAVIIREMAFHVKDLSTYGRVLSTCVANSQNRTRITRINNTRRLVVHNTYARSFPGNTDKHGRIGIVHAHTLLTALPCLGLALRCRARAPPSSGPRRICKIPSPPPCYQPALPLTHSLSLRIRLLTDTLTLTYYTPSLLRTCLAEPLACPPLLRGPERRIPQRSVFAQSHCPTTSHPPACSRAPLAMKPS